MKKIHLVVFSIFILIAQTVFCKGTKEDLSGEYFGIAESYADLKKYDKAVEYYKKAEKSDAYKNATQYNLAQLYALQNDWDNCLAYIEPIYKKAQTNIKIASAYAYALACAGKDKKAISIYEKIYLQSPETPVYFFNYVRILIACKKYNDGLKLLEEKKDSFTTEDDVAILNSLREKIEKLLNPKPESESVK